MSGSEEKKPITSSFKAKVLNFLKKPETVLPAEKEQGEAGMFGNFKTIPFYTGRNDFALVLLGLSELSPTHRSCIYTKAEYAYCEGFGIVNGKTQNIIKTKTAKEQVAVSDDIITAAEEALTKVNLNEETLIEVCRQVRINLETSGNAYIELIKGESQEQKFFNIYNHDFTKVLLEDTGDPRNPVSHVYVCEDWNNISSKNEPVKLPLFPRWEFIDGSWRSMMHVKQYSVGRDFYSLPLFIASKISTQLEYESDRHNIERFYSDFMPKFFAAFFAPDGMTEPEKEKFYDDFLNTYTKKGRSGQTQAMVQVFESENLKPFFHEFQNNDNEGNFTVLKETSGQSIYTAHRWHPVLAGVPISGGLNDAKQIQNIFSIYNKITIKPNQQFDLTKFINPIFKLMAEWLNAPYKGHELTLETSSPMSFFNFIDINKIITVDEARMKILGEDKLNDDRGKFLVAEIGQQFNIQEKGGG